jgi:DNA repair protein RadD
VSFALRDYQLQSVDALMEFLGRPGCNPILALPTGAGKSVIQAAFIKRVLEQWPSERFLLATHSKELLTQNADKIAAMLPGVGVGMFSAGLGRKELGYQITVAGIQSAHKLAHRMGDISIVIIDECHLVSKTDDTMYHRFLADLRKLCPHVRIIGMSATPYRLDSGPLIKGRAAIFNAIAHSVSMKYLIEQGHLARLVSAKTTARANTAGVRVQGGEFVAGELEKAVNVDELTNKALDEAMKLCADRASWIVFCVGVDHAAAVNTAIQARGVSSAVVVGDTLPLERARHLGDFKAGRLRVLVSVGVLTTGFDAPNADALICLRPTQSPGLWVQIVGRVSRTCPGKRDGLVLDFTDNTRTHGPVDMIEVDGDGNPSTSPLMECEKCGDLTPRKDATCVHCGHVRGRPCPKCNQTIPVGTNECRACGYVIVPIEREIKHATKAEGGALLSGVEEAVAETVDGWAPKRHSKPGKPDSVCVEYDTGYILGPRREWICFEHDGYAGRKAALWWVQHGGMSPAPTTVTEAIGRWRELSMPSELHVRRNGKYWEITRAVIQPKENVA